MEGMCHVPKTVTIRGYQQGAGAPRVDGGSKPFHRKHVIVVLLIECHKLIHLWVCPFTCNSQ